MKALDKCKAHWYDDILRILKTWLGYSKTTGNSV